jgi:hypothetical protein
MWVVFGHYKWRSTIVALAQESHMRTPDCYNMSLEEVLHKYYGSYRQPN